MITCRLITEAVCKAYNIPVRQLYSRRKDADTVLPRHMAWTLATRLTTHSYSAVGRMMGGRDHSTVMKGVEKMTSRMDCDPQLGVNYASLVDAITTIDLAGEKSARVRQRFQDIDPLEVAERILAAPFRDVLPSMEEIRALCFGVTHYTAELDRMTDDRDTAEGLLAEPALTPL